MTRVLVVVDYQNDFVDGALGFEASANLKSGIIDMIHEVGKSGGYLLATQDTHDSGYMNTVEGKNLPIEHCIRGTKGWEIEEDVMNALKCYMPKIIEKETFGSLHLATEIRTIEMMERKIGNNGQFTLEFCGVVTDKCVLNNVIIAKAAAPNARIIVHSNLCASNDENLHNMTLDVLRAMHVEVV